MYFYLLMNKDFIIIIIIIIDTITNRHNVTVPKQFKVNG